MRGDLREGEWNAVGRCCALVGVRRAKEKEKVLKRGLNQVPLSRQQAAMLLLGVGIPILIGKLRAAERTGNSHHLIPQARCQSFAAISPALLTKASWPVQEGLFEDWSPSTNIQIFINWAVSNAFAR